tara:strand:- start:2060 stop:2308 length:249 start_codon:yes stop_codon:yes gene_type:complete
MALEDFEYEAGSTSAEFLSIIPPKIKEDHEWDRKEMKRLAEQFKYIPLNPKMDLETAITNTKNLLVNDTGEKYKRLEDTYTD